MKGGRLAVASLMVVGCQATSAERIEIEGRTGESERFELRCLLERDPAGDARLIVRKPDGGFRRLRVTRDGRGVEAADGAERGEIVLIDAQHVELRIGGDAFRLPARLVGR